VIAEFRFPVHVVTKSDLVLRDLGLLKQIGRQNYVAVSFTITTSDDELGKKVEPGSPLVSARFRAMEQLATGGILTGVMMMPILPYIEDNEKNISEIVARTHECGGSYIIPWFGMSLRDRQRAYYYDRLDELFPGPREKYERSYGEQYRADALNANQLAELFYDLCEQLSIATQIPRYAAQTGKQLDLF
jgi:DNA repair photolyase